MMETKQPQCALCPFDWPERLCRSEHGKAPKNCPTVHHQELYFERSLIMISFNSLSWRERVGVRIKETKIMTAQSIVKQSIDEIQSEAVCKFARESSIQESEGYANKEKGFGSLRPVKPRILETVEFAKKMSYNRVGLLFCVGLRKEASFVHKIFENHGLDVISVACKVGRVPKETLGLTEDQKVVPGEFESMCNPVLQAGLVNHYGSQFNILMGLCVGHDSLFIKYSEAPCTVLAVKDRLLGHNPLAAVYQCESYYNYLNTDPHS